MYFWIVRVKRVLQWTSVYFVIRNPQNILNVEFRCNLLHELLARLVILLVEHHAGLCQSDIAHHLRSGTIRSNIQPM